MKRMKQVYSSLDGKRSVVLTARKNGIEIVREDHTGPVNYDGKKGWVFLMRDYPEKETDKRGKIEATLKIGGKTTEILMTFEELKGLILAEGLTDYQEEFDPNP